MIDKNADAIGLKGTVSRSQHEDFTHELAAMLKAQRLDDAAGYIEDAGFEPQSSAADETLGDTHFHDEHDDAGAFRIAVLHNLVEQADYCDPLLSCSLDNQGGRYEPDVEDYPALSHEHAWLQGADHSPDPQAMVLSHDDATVIAPTQWLDWIATARRFGAPGFSLAAALGMTARSPNRRNIRACLAVAGHVEACVASQVAAFVRSFRAELEYALPMALEKQERNHPLG